MSELRVETDGQHYTLREFLTYWGQAKGWQRWCASPVTAPALNEGTPVEKTAFRVLAGRLLMGCEDRTLQFDRVFMRELYALLAENTSQDGDEEEAMKVNREAAASLHSGYHLDILRTVAQGRTRRFLHTPRAHVTQTSGSRRRVRNLNYKFVRAVDDLKAALEKEEK